MSKKIAFFLPHIGSGGLTHVMLLLAGGFAEKEYKVDLVLLDLDIDESLANKIPSNLNIVKLKAKRTFTSIFPFVSYLRKSQPDLLLSGGPSSNCIALISKKLSRASCKQVITEHSLPSVDVYDTSKLTDKFIPFLMKRLYKTADSIVAVSVAVKNDLVNFIQINPNKVAVVYNPVVTEQMLKFALESISHKWLGKKDFKNLIFVGRLEDVKNLPLALSAFSLIDDKNVRFIIVGDGSERENLNSLVKKLSIADKVDFVGYSKNPYAYISKADALVLCSKWEGLPTVVIESLALGIPPLITDNLDGAKEIINSEILGYIAENNNPEHLATAMIKVLSNSADSEALKIRGREFNLVNSVQQYQRIFDELD